MLGVNNLSNTGELTMDSITQKAKVRLSALKFANSHGVTRAANEFHVSRQSIYRWRKRYDGTLESLKDKSRRPHSHPKQHTDAEIELIKKMRIKYINDGLNLFWYRLSCKGYTRSMSALFRVMRRLGLYRLKPRNPKYTPKPYAKADFPGQKIQIDVKVVPKSCIVGQAKELGQKFYQYTAIDECTRLRYLGAFTEQSTYSSMIFLQQLVKAFPFKIYKVQTDNGFEFTKRFSRTKEGDKTLFEEQLLAYGIEYQRIRPYTPRHNGKVERSHRRDNEVFYSLNKFSSFEEFESKLAAWNAFTNELPMRPLNYKSPVEALDRFL